MVEENTDIDIDAFGALKVQNESGSSVVLSNLWKKNPALLVFVRHFG